MSHDSVDITEVVNTVEVTQKPSVNVEISSTGLMGPQGPQGPAGFGSDSAIILGASGASITDIDYTSGLPTTITFADDTEYTSHAKVITYSSGLPTEVEETFTYDSQAWTVTSTITYDGGLPDTKTISVVKV